nr:MAG TPA: protein of unknown function (DUF5471) [Bacteriophage sp.]
MTTKILIILQEVYISHMINYLGRLVVRHYTLLTLEQRILKTYL